MVISNKAMLKTDKFTICHLLIVYVLEFSLFLR